MNVQHAPPRSEEGIMSPGTVAQIVVSYCVSIGNHNGSSAKAASAINYRATSPAISKSSLYFILVCVCMCVCVHLYVCLGTPRPEVLKGWGIFQDRVSC